MQISITIPDEQLPRIKAWMLTQTDPGENPETGEPNPPLTDAELLAEFKRKLKRWVKSEVQQHELSQEHERVFTEYTQIEVTD